MANSSQPQEPPEDTQLKPDRKHLMSASTRSEDSAIHIAQYRILEQIGRGGMGVVFKAVHVPLQKTVAIKLLFGVLDSVDTTARFTHESVALGKMNHPNVVTAFDAGISANGPYLVTEFVDGTSLTDIVKKRGPLSVASAAQVGLEVVQGLQHIHSHNLVHRDIKPSNLMLTSSGQVKILDLGIALLHNNSEHLTGTGQILGTYDFMAPEQWLNSHDVDYRADIYGLACTLYYLLAGRAPFAGHAHAADDRMASHLSKPFPSLQGIRSDVPAELDQLIQAMAEKDPKRRTTDLAKIKTMLSAWAVNADLLAECQSEPSEASQNRVADASPVALLSQAEPPAKTQRRLRAVAIGLLAVLTASIAYVVYVNVPPKQVGGANGALNTLLAPLPGDDAIELLDSRLLYQHDGRVNNIDMLWEHGIIVSVGEDRAMKFYDLKNHAILPWKVSHSEPVTDAILLDDHQVISICTDGKLRKWSRVNDQLNALCDLPKSTSGGMIGLDVTKDGTRATTGGWDQQVRLWDMTKQNEIASHHADDVVYDVAITADGNHVFYGGRDGAIHVWNVNEDLSVSKFSGHAGWVMAIDLSPDENYCASASFDNTVRVWDMASGEEVLKVEAVQPKTVRYFAGGRFLVFGERSGRIHVWDIPNKKEILVLKDQGPIDALWISPDGTTLLSGTNQGTVTHWQLRLK